MKALQALLRQYILVFSLMAVRLLSRASSPEAFMMCFVRQCHHQHHKLRASTGTVPLRKHKLANSVTFLSDLRKAYPFHIHKGRSASSLQCQISEPGSAHENKQSLRSAKTDDRFIRQVETTINRVIECYTKKGIDIVQSDQDHVTLFSLPDLERETVGITRHLHERIQSAQRNNDCRRCWFQQAHCICHQIPPLDLFPESSGHNPTTIPIIRRIFVLTHHKEIYMAVDTAKIILAAFPEHSRLVIGGIPGMYQDSMKEMMEMLSDAASPVLILYPSDNAMTFTELLPTLTNKSTMSLHTTTKAGGTLVDGAMPAGDVSMRKAVPFDIVVIDGTWEQARRLYNRYIADHPVMNVQLSVESLNTLDRNDDDIPDNSNNSIGKQLRRHPIPIREIATAHALQLLLEDISSSASGLVGRDEPTARDDLQRFGAYLEISKRAAVAQLGPTRPRQS